MRCRSHVPDVVPPMPSKPYAAVGFSYGARLPTSSGSAASASSAQASEHLAQAPLEEPALSQLAKRFGIPQYAKMLALDTYDPSNEEPVLAKPRGNQNAVCIDVVGSPTGARIFQRRERARLLEIERILRYRNEGGSCSRSACTLRWATDAIVTTAQQLTKIFLRIRKAITSKAMSVRALRLCVLRRPWPQRRLRAMRLQPVSGARNRGRPPPSGSLSLALPRQLQLLLPLLFSVVSPSLHHRPRLPKRHLHPRSRNKMVFHPRTRLPAIGLRMLEAPHLPA